VMKRCEGRIAFVTKLSVSQQEHNMVRADEAWLAAVD